MNKASFYRCIVRNPPKGLAFGLLLLLSLTAFTQDSLFTPSYDSNQVKISTIALPNKVPSRIRIMSAVNIAGYGGALLALNNAWYKNYPRSSFHAFNDIKEWQQVDKVGHAWTAYNAGKVACYLWRWTGMQDKKAILIGGLSSAFYMTAIEVMDGFSAEWGWSWGDVGANVLGSGLFMAQELRWKTQKIQYKFSFHGKNYAGLGLANRANSLFGSSWYERMLKDYNGQTYWLSANIRSFFPAAKIPRWMNIAVGYGADGMMGGFDNKWASNGIPVDRSDIKRYRQWYLAPDIDLTKIKTKKRGVKILLEFLNSFKFPLPSLEFSNGRFHLNAIHF